MFYIFLEVNRSATLQGAAAEIRRTDSERKGSDGAHRLDLFDGLCGGHRAGFSSRLYFCHKAGLYFFAAQAGCALSFGLLGPLHHRHRMFRRNGGGYSARGIHDFRLQRDDLRHLHDDAADVSDHPLLRLLYEPLLSRDRADSARARHALGLRRALQLCFYESELLRILHFPCHSLLHLQYREERKPPHADRLRGADPAQSACARAHGMPHDLRRAFDRMSGHAVPMRQEKVGHRLPRRPVCPCDRGAAL